MASSPFQNRSGLVGGFSITMEEFKVFHSIDRQLYTRLVTDLGRDPAESMQVMALLLWLERSTRDMHLVSRLLRLHEAILSYVIEEAATVLKVVENDEFPYAHEDVKSSEIPLLQTLMAKNDDVTLRFFHNHRLGVIRGVTHLMNEICVKAFNDIMQRVLENRQHSLFQVSPNSSGMLGNVPFRPPSGFNSNVPRVRLFAPGSSSGTPIPYDGSIDPRAYIEATAVPPPYDLQVQRDIMNSQMGELLDEVFTTCITGDDQRQIGSEVPPDDRTIFLTFSKGYPISENEVREFFTRRNGDVIEAIYMQEVPPEEQILYARMVIKSPALIDVILGGMDVKAKFAINGKHVWGRKYVKKSGGAAGASSSSSLSGGGQQ